MLAWKPKSCDPRVASARFRCLVPLKELNARKFPITLFDEKSATEYSGIIFSKCYDKSDHALARELRARGGRVILDLCDNHFYNPSRLPAYKIVHKNLLEMISLSDQIVCSTTTLADIVMVEASLSRRPEVVGDPVEPTPFSSKIPWWRKLFSAKSSAVQSRRLLWFGIHGSPNAPCGMSDICNVAEALVSLHKAYPFELVVCSNNSEEFARRIRPLDFPSSYVEYSQAVFPRLLAGMDGVILPVTLNPFTLAKSHNRLTTALFSGIPVVADGIPSYREFEDFCTLDDWPRGLYELFSEPGKARNRALLGKRYIEQKWMPVHVANNWEKILSPLVKDIWPHHFELASSPAPI